MEISIWLKKRLLTVFLVFYTLLFWFLFYKAGFFPLDGSVFFVSPDAQLYRAYADAIVAGNIQILDADIISLRTYFYPLFLSAYKYLGVGVFFSIQWAMNIVTLIIIYHILLEFRVSLRFRYLGLSFIIVNPTFSFISLHALSEVLSMFILSVTLLHLVRYSQDGTKDRFYLVLFFLSFLVIIKPVFLPFLLLFVVYHFYMYRESIKIYKFMLAIFPLLSQMLLSKWLIGEFTISSAGSENFVHRFYPAVWGFSELGQFISYKSELAIEAKQVSPDLIDKIIYLILHPLGTLEALLWITYQNMTSYSHYVGSDAIGGIDLRTLSQRLNVISLCFHIIVIIYGFLLIKRNAKEFELAMLLVLLNLSVVFLSSLTYWQGDRLVSVILPSWLILYVVVFTAQPIKYRSFVKNLLDTLKGGGDA